MKVREEIKGNIYGKLQALGVYYRKNKRIFELVKCLNCGSEHYVDRPTLLIGKCGCRLCSHKKHGMFNTRFYNTYRMLKSRCNTKTRKCYKDYGGRGIKCEWETFEQFKEDMYESYIKHVKEYGEKQTTIDRIDVNGNYCKENCRRATYKEQNANKRKNKSDF